MYSLQTQNLIKERLNVLKPQRQEWDELERLRKKFVKDYSVRNLEQLHIDDYVIGKGAENRSFCYRIERELDRLGRIRGTRAQRFGVYYGTSAGGPGVRYQYALRWGSNYKTAFKAIKDAIIDLINAAKEDDMEFIRASRISPLLKGKILYLYFPETYAPIYSPKHLVHFAAELNLTGHFKNPVDIQRALMECRKNFTGLSNVSGCLYMRLLYDVFGYPPDEADEPYGVDETEPKARLSELPLLNIAIGGAKILDSMPQSLQSSQRDRGNSETPDFEGQSQQARRIGDRGEAIVFAIEQKRLKVAGKENLARKVTLISAINSSAGYDILSYDENGNERYIEVKATTGHNLSGGFYLTGNELKKSTEIENFYIYFVFNTETAAPQVFRMQQPDLNGDHFKLRPLVYHVAVSGFVT